MTNKKKIHFIINPISGVGRHKLIEKYIDKNIDKTVFDYDISYTKHPLHGTQIAGEAIKNNYEIIVAVGGDGSINEIAQKLIGSNTILGIIPTGSGNGLAHHLNIPINILHAIDVINNLKTIKIDTATINNNIFVSIAGVGFDAHVAKKFAKNKRRGFLTYFKIVAREYPRYKPKNYELTIDGKKINKEALFISFANSDQFGYNTTIAPKAEIDDGLIDVCIVKKFPLVELPFIANLLYWKQIDKSKYVEVIKAKKIKLTQEKNKTINLDGEPVKLGKVLNIKINPLSLKIIVP
jgi:YegS/Rv2252/BmrU family lipid kinase